MSERPSLLVRLALRCVPYDWRASVARDLDDEAGRSRLAGWWCAAEALGIAVLLHWSFTRSAVMSDVRYAIRSLLHARWFTVGAILTFALGIGVNVAVFSAVDRMLFRPLPYAQPESLVVMGQSPVGDSRFYGTVPAEAVVEARRLPAVAEVSTTDWNAEQYRATQAADGAHYLSFTEVSYTTLGLVGVRPRIGRDFTLDDARSKTGRLLISDATWQHDFGGRPDVIGQRMWESYSNAPAEIIGVLPADFIAPGTFSSIPGQGIVVTDDTFASAAPTVRFTPPVVRLRPGVSIAEAQAQVTTLFARLQASAPPPPNAVHTEMRVVSLREAMYGSYAKYLGLVFAAATMVLLVACANLASLLLVRGRARERRAAVQLALGAGRRRLVQAAVVEALLLASAGGALAVLVLIVANQALLTWLPPLFSHYAAPVGDQRVLAFSMGTAFIAAVVAGVLPGWRSARVDVLEVLQRGTGRTGAGRLRGGSTVLALETAVTLVLVACAAFTSRSLVGLLRRDIGFNPDGLAMVTAYLPMSKDTTLLLQQYTDMLGAIRTIPAVQSAAGSSVPPVIGAVNRPIWNGEGRGQRWEVTDGFIETMGMRLIAGRTFTPGDVHGLAPVALLSVRGLAFVWPGVTPQAAVGRTLPLPGEASREIIGIVSDVRGEYADPGYPSMYVPLGPDQFRTMRYMVRLKPGATLAPIDVSRRLEQQGYAPTGVSVLQIATRFELGVADQRFRAELFSSFGAIALLLAMVGLYAVQSFNVAVRRSEMGIRLSLGATREDLWRLLIADTLRPVLVGAAIGAVLMSWAAQFLQSFLVLVDARNPLAYVLAAAVLTATALVAVWIPARRAARTDPAIVLRSL